VDPGAGVFDEVLGGGLAVISSRRKDAPIFGAQRRETGAGQPIGEEQEGFMVENRAVAVLSAAAT